MSTCVATPCHCRACAAFAFGDAIAACVSVANVTAKTPAPVVLTSVAVIAVAVISRPVESSSVALSVVTTIIITSVSRSVVYSSVIIRSVPVAVVPVIVISAVSRSVAIIVAVCEMIVTSMLVSATVEVVSHAVSAFSVWPAVGASVIPAASSVAPPAVPSSVRNVEVRAPEVEVVTVRITCVDSEMPHA